MQELKRFSIVLQILHSLFAHNLRVRYSFVRQQFLMIKALLSDNEQFAEQLNTSR